MKISGDWIERPQTQAVCRMLTDAGHQALFVGGCVRNSLLGAPVADIDIATDALPDQVMALAAANGLKPVPTGIEHGTITVVSEGVPHEVTTFRKDVETFGRRAVVAFSTEVSEDALRRDFTMNALYAESSGFVIDPLGGLPDLKARRVRFIEDSAQRIREDYLRILRFFRFHAWYGDADAGLDAEGLAACAELVDGIENLSKERIGRELLKLLSAPDPAPSVAAMRTTGALAHTLPGADDTFLAPLVHIEQDASMVPDGLRRLSALGGEDVSDQLRLSRTEAKEFELLRIEMGQATPPHELGYRRGAVRGRDALALRASMENRMITAQEKEDILLGAEARFPIAAKDLMSELDGEALGTKLKALEAAWIASRFTLSKENLLGDRLL